MEEIKVVVREVSEGTAIADAQKAAERLKATQQNNGGRSSLATPPPDINAQPAVVPAASGAARQTARAEAALSREIATSTRAEATATRAGGDHAGAAALEREAEILTRSAAIQTRLNNSTAEATAMATAQVAQEEAIAAAKAEQATAAKTAATAAAQQKAIAAERLASERELSRETLRRTGEEKLAASKNSAALARAGQAAGMQPGPLSGIGSMGFSPAQIALVVGAAIAGAVASALIKKSDEIRAAEGRGVESGQRRGMIGGKTGVEAEQYAAQDRLQNKQALEDATAKRGSFRDTGIGNFLKRSVGLGRFTDAAIEERKNNLEIARLEKEKPEAERLAAEKFTKGTGGDEMQAREREAEGDKRGAWALRKRIEWEKEYQTLRQAGAAEEVAQHGASLKLYDEEKNKRLEVAGQLVNARSGAADVSRAARFAGGANDISRTIESAIHGLHTTVRDQHAAVLDRPQNRKFYR